MTIALVIYSFKLRVADHHVRIVHSKDALNEPGVDLRGAEADQVIALATPMVEWIGSMEPDIEIRSLAIECKTRRITAVLVPPPKTTRTRVVRLDGFALPDLWERTASLLPCIMHFAQRKLARREAAKAAG